MGVCGREAPAHPHSSIISSGMMVSGSRPAKCNCPAFVPLPSAQPHLRRGEAYGVFQFYGENHPLCFGAFACTSSFGPVLPYGSMGVAGVPSLALPTQRKRPKLPRRVSHAEAWAMHNERDDNGQDHFGHRIETRPANRLPLADAWGFLRRPARSGHWQDRQVLL